MQSLRRRLLLAESANPNKTLQGIHDQQVWPDGAEVSLLVDHCFLLHPDQLARIENKQPASTVGSLSNRVKVDSLLTIIRELVAADNPVAQLQRLAQQLEELFPLNPSDKHMIDRDMGRLEPTPSMKYKALL